MTDKYHYVFVYGTLKRGHGLHNALKYCKCVADSAETIDTNFKMVYSNGERGFPFVFRTPNEGRKIKGEVYLVDEGTLHHLDIIEGVPYLYERKEVAFVGHPKNGKPFKDMAFMYISPIERNGVECGPEEADYYDWR